MTTKPPPQVEKNVEIATHMLSQKVRRLVDGDIALTRTERCEYEAVWTQNSKPRRLSMEAHSAENARKQLREHIKKVAARYSR